MKTWAAALVLFTLTFPAGAQQPQKAPWASDLGYWVVESKLSDPKNHTIRFYNNSDELLYTETLKNIRLNPERKSTKMKLKKALESFMAVRGQNREAAAGGAFVVAVL